MEYIRNFTSIYYIELIVGLIAGFLVLFILYLIAEIRINKTKKHYKALVHGIENINIEELLIQIDKEIKDIHRDIGLIERNISAIETKLTFAIQKIGFIRYNAFRDMGSELSFSIALLDNFQNGFVLTSIYGRESSVSYAKPINNGVSRIPLSPEEILAIDRALRGEALEKTF